MTRKLYLTDNCGSVISCGIPVATLKYQRHNRESSRIEDLKRLIEPTMYRLIYGIAFLIVLLVNDVICSELMVDDEFVVIDGIRVKKDSIRNETSDGNRKYGKRDKKAEKTESDDEDQDEEDEDDDDEDDDEEEIDISQEEDLESTKHLPTKCHGKKMLLKCFFYVNLINKFKSSFSSTYVKQ